MKLSEAIREGAKLLPQQTRHAFFERSGNECVASSAWGAAYHAEFGLDTAWMDVASMWRKLVRAFPETRCAIRLPDGMIRAQKKPDQASGSGSVEFVIDYLQVQAGWTREQIADYLDTQAVR